MSHKVFCSSCGGEFHREDSQYGFSHCEDHQGMHNFDEDDDATKKSEQFLQYMLKIRERATDYDRNGCRSSEAIQRYNRYLRSFSERQYVVELLDWFSLSLKQIHEMRISNG